MFEVFATISERTGPAEIAERARRAEAMGYAGLASRLALAAPHNPAEDEAVAAATADLHGG